MINNFFLNENTTLLPTKSKQKENKNVVTAAVTATTKNKIQYLFISSLFYEAAPISANILLKAILKKGQTNPLIIADIAPRKR